MNDYCIVITTCANKEDARVVILKLLEEKLAACVQVVGINSWYTWKGSVNNEVECLLVIKTKKDLYQAVEECILKNHKYEVPEIIQVPIEAGFVKYLSWIDEVTGK